MRNGPEADGVLASAQGKVPMIPPAERAAAPDLAPFLAPTYTVESEHPTVLALKQRACHGVDDDHQRARRLFLLARDSIRYSPYTPFFALEHFKATATLKRGSGQCIQKAVLLTSLLRSAGIPSRLVFADITNDLARDNVFEFLGTNLLVYHSYVQLYLDGAWLAVTPAFDRELCLEHGFPLVDFDGWREAVFPRHDSLGRSFVQYHAHHGTFADLPLERILRAWSRAYGPQRLESWKRALRQESGSF